MRFDRPRPLTAAQQFCNLRANSICRGEGQLRAGRLIWQYDVSPSPLSRIYGARIEFVQDNVPSVYIDKPDLALLAAHRDLPHVYEQKPPRLCLYLPRTYEWQSWMRLDQTIVPWTALWLFYFEEWLSSNEWKGEGEHPMERPERHKPSKRAHSHEIPSVKSLPT